MTLHIKSTGCNAMQSTSCSCKRGAKQGMVSCSCKHDIDIRNLQNKNDSDQLYLHNLNGKLKTINNEINKRQHDIDVCDSVLKLAHIDELDTPEYARMYGAKICKKEYSEFPITTNMHTFLRHKLHVDNDCVLRLDDLLYARQYYNIISTEFIKTGMWRNLHTNSKHIGDIKGNRIIPIEYYIKVYYDIKKWYCHDRTQYTINELNRKKKILTCLYRNFFDARSIVPLLDHNELFVV